MGEVLRPREGERRIDGRHAGKSGRRCPKNRRSPPSDNHTATLSRNLLDRPRRTAETPLSAVRVRCWHSIGVPARWGPVRRSDGWMPTARRRTGLGRSWSIRRRCTRGVVT